MTEKAHNSTKKHDLIYLIPRVAFGFGYALIACNRLRKAESVLQHALAIAEETGERWGGGLVRALLATINCQKSGLEEALLDLDLLLTEATERGDKVAWWYGRWATVRCRRIGNDYQGAIKHGLRLYNDATQNEARHISILCLLEIMQAATKTRTTLEPEILAEAAEAFENMLAVGRRWFAWELGQNLALMYMKVANLNATKLVWSKCINILQEMKPDVPRSVYEQVFLAKAQTIGRELVLAGLSDSARSLIAGAKMTDLRTLSSLLDNFVDEPQRSSSFGIEPTAETGLKETSKHKQLFDEETLTELHYSIDPTTIE